MADVPLNRLVTIEQPPTGQDALGQPLLTWTTVDTAWANIRHLKGLESIKSGAPTSEVKVSIRTRYRTDITAGMRFTEDGEIYRITAVLPDRVDRQYVDFTCEVVT